MPIALRLTDHQHELVAAYHSALEAAGMSTHPVRLWPAKAFCNQVGSPEAWSRLSLDEQCALHPRLRSFVGWLMVSGRLAATPENPVAGQPQLGRIAQAHHGALHAVFATTASELGYSHSVIKDQWSLLVRVAAMNQQAPDAVSRMQLQAACGAIVQAEARYAPGRVRGRASVAKFRGGLEAVLFHAGLIDETPSARPSGRQDRQKVEGEWAQVPPRTRAIGRACPRSCRGSSAASTRPGRAHAGEAPLNR